MSNAVSVGGALQSLKLYKLQRNFSLCDDVLDVAISALEEVQQYRAIGTVSEFRELKEKATAKKPIETDWLRCPNCNATLFLGEKHCICGQKLDWSEGKERWDGLT